MATGLAWPCCRGWGPVGEGSGGVELEGSAPKEAGSARGRKNTELQVMAGLPGSTSGPAGNLEQVTPPLPRLVQLSGELNIQKTNRARSCTHVNHSSYRSSGMCSGRQGRCCEKLRVLAALLNLGRLPRRRGLERGAGCSRG